MRAAGAGARKTAARGPPIVAGRAAPVLSRAGSARAGEVGLRAAVAGAGGALEPVERLFLVGSDHRALEIRHAQEVAHLAAAAADAVLGRLARALDDRRDVAAT